MNDEQGARIKGQLHLCDLAGSERIARSGAEGDRLKALASTTAAAAGGGAGVPSDADLLRTARQLQTPDAAFAEAPPAPSTAELLELLDSYEDANNRPAAFGDVRLPDGALVPGPTITSL